MAERDKKDGEEAKGEENAKPQEEVQGMGLDCGRGIVDRPGSHSGAGREPHRNTEGGIPGFLPGPPTRGESGVGGTNDCRLARAQRGLGWSPEVGGAWITPAAERSRGCHLLGRPEQRTAGTAAGTIPAGEHTGEIG